MSHTRGPWKVKEVDGVINIVAHDCVPARVNGDATGSPEPRANAFLIAASPRLLEAVEYYEGGIDYFYSRIDFGKSSLDAKAINFMNESNIKIRQALKLAKGGQDVNRPSAP